MKLKSILILLLIILALPLVCATSAVEYNGFEGVITSNGEVVYTSVSTLPQITQQILHADYNNGFFTAPGTYDIKRYNWYEKHILGKQNTHFFVSQNKELQITMKQFNSNGIIDTDFSTGAVILNNIAVKQMYTFNDLSMIEGGRGGTATLSIFSIRQSDLDYTYKKIKARGWEKWSNGKDNKCSKTGDYLVCQIDSTLEAVAVIDNNNLNQINNFNVLGYKCEDKTCSVLGQKLWDKSSTNNKLTITYPENSKANKRYGYGLYFYKDGYIPYEVNSYFTGKGQTITENIMFTKKQNAHAPIENLKIQNTAYTNMPVMIEIETGVDAQTYSALRNAGPLKAIPEQLKSFYQVDTRVTLTVKNSITGQIVFGPNPKDISIDYSGSQKISFEWTPQQGQTGTFDIIVATDVIDEKCDQNTKIAQQTSKTIQIIQDREALKNKCYTILNNLETSNQYLTETSTLTIYLNKLANYMDEDGYLTPVETEITLNILDSSNNIVYTQILNLNAHTDAYTQEQFSFDIPYVFSQGQYTIQITGTTENDNICISKENIVDTISAEIIVSQANPDENQAPTIFIPNQELKIKESITLNLNKYIDDKDSTNLQLIIVKQPNENIVDLDDSKINNNQITLTGISAGTTTMNIEVTDGKESARHLFTITVKSDDENQPPVITSYPETNTKEKQLYTYQVTAEDPENDFLQYTLTESPADMTIDPQTGLIQYTPKYTGTYQVRISVSDGYNTVKQSYKLHINILRTKKHLFTFSSEISALNHVAEQGKQFTNYILLRNIGQEPEDDIRIRLTIPEIGFSQQIIKELKLGPHDTKWIPLIFKVPDNAKQGTHLLVLEISNSHHSEIKYGTIEIKEKSKISDKYLFI